MTAVESEHPVGQANAVPPTEDMLCTLVGRFMFNWSNNESMLIYVIMELMRTDEISAAVVYSTLNTTRARLDLVRRLAKLHLRDRTLRRRLDDLIERFNGATRLRNEFQHSIYARDADGKLSQMRALRISETRRRISFGDPTMLDAHRIEQLEATLGELQALNRDLWAMLPDLRTAMAGRRDGVGAGSA